ncbi:hypothetical protein BH23BAC4_BH23BAC4_17720 [soil metagenome]
MLKSPRTVSRRSETREEVALTGSERALDFLEEHRTLLIAGAVGLILLIGGIFAFQMYRSGQEDRAAELLASSLPLYEAGEFAAALEGQEGEPGLREVADRFGSTPSGNIARFYTGNALFELGQYGEARDYFQRVSGRTNIISASALDGRAAAYEADGDHARAARLYEQAADAYNVDAIAPERLLNAARNYEAAGDHSAARRAYEKIENDYPETTAGRNVQIHLARLDAAATAE